MSILGPFGSRSPVKAPVHASHQVINAPPFYEDKFTITGANGEKRTVSAGQLLASCLWRTHDPEITNRNLGDAGTKCEVVFRDSSGLSSNGAVNTANAYIEYVSKNSDGTDELRQCVEIGHLGPTGWALYPELFDTYFENLGNASQESRQLMGAVAAMLDVKLATEQKRQVGDGIFSPISKETVALRGAIDLATGLSTDGGEARKVIIDYAIGLGGLQPRGAGKLWEDPSTTIALEFPKQRDIYGRPWRRARDAINVQAVIYDLGIAPADYGSGSGVIERVTHRVSLTKVESTNSDDAPQDPDLRGYFHSPLFGFPGDTLKPHEEVALNGFAALRAYEEDNPDVSVDRGLCMAKRGN